MNNVTARLAIFASALTIAMGLCTVTAYAQESDQIIGPIVHITANKVIITSPRTGSVTLKIDPTKTACFDSVKLHVDCASLAEVGYADKASVTFAGDMAQRVEILELQQ